MYFFSSVSVCFIKYWACNVRTMRRKQLKQWHAESARLGHYNIYIVVADQEVNHEMGN